jgi:hypothetical protein
VQQRGWGFMEEFPLSDVDMGAVLVDVAARAHAR